MTMNNPNPFTYDDLQGAGADSNYEASFANKMKEMLAVPDTKDFAAVIIRGNFKNDRQANAILRLSRRHQKFSQTQHQELLRQKIASTAAIGGLGRVESMFIGINMLAGDIYRAAKGMPKVKEEKIYRGGSDFRTQDRPQEGAERPR